MKKLLAGLFLLSSPLWGAGNTVNLTVSSGTYQAVSMYSNNDGGNRQAIVIGDFTSSDTVRVDAVTGLRVNLSTGSLTTSGALMCVSTATTLTNTGFNVNNTPAVTQSGTWTVQPGNSANTTAWKVDGSAVTQPVSGTFWQATQPISGSVTVVPGSQNIVITSTTTLPVSLAANQSVNVAQINGVTPLMGNGATGTGSHRATISNDNTGIANWGHGATASAVPAAAQYHGGLAVTAWPSAASNGNMVGSSLDKMGRAIGVLDCPYDLQITTTVTISASTAETLLLSSGTSGVFNDLVSLAVSNSGSTASLMTFRNTGFATTGWLHIFVPATDTRGLTTAHPIPQQASASAWTVQGSASSTSIFVDATFCQRK